MILSDRSIKKEIEKGSISLNPFNPTDIQPSSIDVHLDKSFLIFNKAQHSLIDVKKKTDDLMKEVIITEEQPFILHPGEFVLGSTLESVKLSASISARIEGKSSLGRIGLLIHSTAGFVDAGWEGKLTLELSNVSPLPITLYYNMKIGQISFMQLSSPVERPYGSEALGSKYQNQEKPEASKFYKNFKQ